MASRENQTMQIFVIVLALGFLLVSVGLVMVNSARKTGVAQLKSAKESENAARETLRKKDAESSNYKLWLGYPESDTYETLQKNFADDMQRWGSTFDEQSRAFRTILENIFEENNKLAQSEVDSKAQAKGLKQQLLAIEKQKNEQISEYEAKTKKALEKQESLRNTFEQDRHQITEEKGEIAAQLGEQRQTIDELVAKHDAADKVLQNKIVKLERVIEILKNNQATPDPYAQPEDGLIRWVNQREGKVWINLGSADQLRPQVTFSVYSGDANDVRASVSKGSVEVVRILSEHMAEARITGDQAIRPLMEGDKVYSQVWNRGRQVGFAITGVVDLDGDTRSDIAQLRKIIQLNNGKVDAYPNEEGGIEGEMTVDTRYLILGKHPEDARTTSAAARKAYQKMSAEADTLNIEAIALDDFLSLMGWRAEHRAIRAGEAPSSDAFRARRRPDATPIVSGSGNKSQFRSRKPQASY